MIAVRFNKRNFEYDVHSLVRAFYPGVDVPIYETGEEEPDYEWQIAVDYGDTRIRIRFLEKDKTCTMERQSEIAENEKRPEIKNVLKHLLYQMLSEKAGTELSWGTLSGIRPVKIPVSLLESGMSNVQVAEHMRKTYLTSKEKTALSIMIANRERHILKDIDYQNGYSLYVGIPFCPSICLYCSFSSSPIKLWKDKVDLYLDALFKEIEFCGDLYRKKKLNTVYIGGGTPTTLEPEQLDRLLFKVAEHFDLKNILEFTVEAGRPDSITREKLQVLQKHGITRISINPQTMSDKTLEIIGRKHSSEQTREAFVLAREIGFTNINMDLIVGLPGEEYEDVQKTLEEVKNLAPESMTVHSLAVKRAARLNMFKDEYKEMTFTNSSKIMDMASEYAFEMGMSPYYLYRQKNMAGNFENVGYATAEAAGIYNILIMEEVQTILALGAGAATKIVCPDGRIERVENVKDIKLYIERIDEMLKRKEKMLESLE